MDKVDTALAGVIDKLSDLASQFPTKAALDLAYGVTMIDGLSMLVIGVGLLLAIVLILAWPMKVALRAYKKANEKDRYGMDDTGPFICIAICILGMVCLSIGAFILLFDVWNWIALFNPKLALAHDILAKALSYTK